MNTAAPTPVPINDIVGPVWFLPYPVWMIVTAAVLLVLILALLVWGLRALLTKKRPATPQELALAALEQLRSNMSGVEPYAFGISVSDAIRT